MALVITSPAHKTFLLAQIWLARVPQDFRLIPRIAILIKVDWLSRELAREGPDLHLTTGIWAQIHDVLNLRYGPEATFGLDLNRIWPQ